MILNTGPVFSLRHCSSSRRSSASTHMLRNLCILNVRPSRPTRSCKKMTGPFGSSAFTRIAMIAYSQQKHTSTAALNTTSNARLMNR